jgi:hypothetical protein
LIFWIVVFVLFSCLIAAIGVVLGLDPARVFAATFVSTPMAISIATYETPTGVTREARLWQFGFVILLWLVAVLTRGAADE